MTADAPEKRASAHLMELRGYFIGLPVEAVTKVVTRPPSSMELTQVHGTLRAFSARFSLQRVESGTEIVYCVEADPAIPMISDDAARQFLVQHVERLLDRVRFAAERKTPPRRPRSGGPRSAEVPGPPSAEADEEAAGEGPAEMSSEGPGASDAPGEGPTALAAEGTAPPRNQTRESQAPAAEGAPAGHRRRRRRRRHRGSGGSRPSPAGPSGA
jgi:hypothetical protein